MTTLIIIEPSSINSWKQMKLNNFYILINISEFYMMYFNHVHLTPVLNTWQICPTSLHPSNLVFSIFNNPLSHFSHVYSQLWGQEQPLNKTISLQSHQLSIALLEQGLVDSINFFVRLCIGLNLFRSYAGNYSCWKFTYRRCSFTLAFPGSWLLESFLYELYDSPWILMVRQRRRCSEE